MERFRKFLLKNKITPKWVIFLIDLIACALCYLYANFLLSDFKIVSFYQHELVYGLILVCLTNCLFYVVFKTYDGIIRLSEFQESLRSVSAVFCTFFVLITLNIFLKVLHFQSYIANSSLIVYFFTSSFVITGYRILVRKLYSVSLEQSEITNVVVYGCEHHGTIFKKALLGEMGLKYRVVAFVDNDERFTGKSIDGIPIYPLKNLPQLLQELQVQMMFFANPDLDGRIKNQVVDVCLSRKVRVMNIPPLKQWLHGHLEASQMQEVKIEELLGRPSIKLNNEQHLDNMISGKRILITGAAGSIGSEMARQLVAIQPEMLVLCDQSETGLHDLYYELETKYNFGRHSQIFLCDIKDRRSVEQMYRLHRPEIVFHAAAYKHVPVMENHPSEAIRNNVLGTKVCADLAIEYGVERFLLVSTDKAINPTNIMGASKRIAEIYCNIVQDLFSAQQQKVVNMPGSKTKFITTRFGNVLASNGSVIPRFHEQIQNGGPVTVTHPDIIRYFMTIQEACSLVLEAVTMGKGGEIFMFDMGEPVRIYDLATKMIRLAGHEPGEDIKIQFTGLRPGEKLYEELLNKKEEVIPTHHAKILIATKAKLDDSMMANKIIELLAAADLCNDSMVVKIMKEMVPEYISNNPVYALFHEVSDISDEKKLTALN